MFSRRSVRTQFGLIFVGFLLLVAGSVAATLLTLRTHTTDTHVINLAGQQRTLVHRMIWLALTQPDAPALAASMDLFEQGSIWVSGSYASNKCNREGNKALPRCLTL